MQAGAHDGADERPRRNARQTLRDYARGAAGGLLVAVPLLFTMELWWSGFHMPAGRMSLFLLFTFGVLLILEHYSGFREDETFGEEFEDAVVALGIGFVVATVVLFAFSVLRPGMALREIAGKIILQAVPVSIGVSVAASELGERAEDARRKRESTGFWGMQTVAIAGAMFFGVNIAPIEEPVVLAVRMEWWHALLLLLLSLALTYAIVYAVGFRGAPDVPHARAWWEALLESTTTTYAIALVIAAYLLWTFGRIGPDTGLLPTLYMVVTLGFVTTLGAAAANLIL